MKLLDKSLSSRKRDHHKEYARQYMEAARRKGAPPADEFRRRPFRGAETFTDPESSYNIRYAVPLPLLHYYRIRERAMDRKLALASAVANS